MPIADQVLSESETANVDQVDEIDILNLRFIDVPPEELPPFDNIDIKSTSSSDDEDEYNHILPTEFINTKYACLRATPYEPNYNKRLICLLSLVEQSRELEGENIRAASYAHVISALKTYPRPLGSIKEAEKIIGVGVRIRQKIQQFLETGTIEEAEGLRHSEEFRTRRLFSKVYGVGPVTAKIWWDVGYRTLQEVFDNAQLTSTVRLGIQLFPHFHQKMNRSDAEEMISIIQDQVSQLDHKIYITPVGGYRRGKPETADLDLIISALEGTPAQLLISLLDKMRQIGLLKHIVSHTRRRTSKGSASSYMYKQFGNELELYTCAILQPSKEIMRQVDFVVAEPDQYVTAVLGWTGTRHFEKSLRDYAKREKHMTLNSEAIILENRSGKAKLTPRTEEEAFEILGVPYLDPTLRNC
ncbi:hypothetical protein G6F46_006885 [Rhizopus delemar]|uniref:DNA polymerase n=2 Tax=Rhizopus TaxID=4842 RepID=A0A9P7CN58_9FUNG|nr:hypothetical protein G6F55_005574 [Rhizopus delemar]KAG1542798.1 hypothetical protein G6F51_007063 [Rhizopus arrhizus]KAG1496731.1 hypothetical protein G6F54_006264 [Rhizopus delemar]KAG1510465.1 hypothetical protein G6F53_006664 [Rhizopus delemar]KAG1525846.1 hypothetical protein G6F52_002962 [Rhizopus delemar]